MKIDSLTVGPIGTNCYILQEEQAKLCAVIDPGDEAERIEKAVESTGCTPVMILLTHGHFDHYTAVGELLKKWPELPVYICEKDVTDQVSGGYDLLFPRLTEKNQRYYKDGDRLTLGSLTISVLETPGHSRGSVLRQLRPHRLCRRQLPGYPPVAEEAGAAARAVPGLPGARPAHGSGL